MPFPVILAAGAAAVALWEGGAKVIEIAERIKPTLFDAPKDWIAAACGDMGLELSEDGQLTEASLTATVNKLLDGSGVKLDSLLDRDKLRAGLERDGVALVAQRLGLDVPTGARGGVSAIKDHLQSWALEQADAQLQAGAGELFDAATPEQKIIDAAEICPKPKDGWNTATVMTPKGIANRARQAKYRATHTRVWVPKSSR